MKIRAEVASRWDLLRPVLETVLQTELREVAEAGERDVKPPRFLVELSGDEIRLLFRIGTRVRTELLYPLLDRFRLSPVDLAVEVEKTPEVLHEFKVFMYHALAGLLVEEAGAGVDICDVHPAVLLPLYFGPTRRGLSWARVAAGATLYAYSRLDYDVDLNGTLCVLEKIVEVFAERMNKLREIQALAHEVAMMYVRPTRPYQDWLLEPYVGKLGAELHDLRSCQRAVLAATETLSPYTLHLLSGMERIYLIYTPNVYQVVKYSLEAVDGELRGRVKRVLASSYNPHINYEIFKALIAEEACYLPKFTGPAPVYLALKKLEKEGRLRQASR